MTDKRRVTHGVTVETWAKLGQNLDTEIGSKTDPCNSGAAGARWEVQRTAGAVVGAIGTSRQVFLSWDPELSVCFEPGFVAQFRKLSTDF